MEIPFQYCYTPFSFSTEPIITLMGIRMTVYSITHCFAGMQIALLPADEINGGK